MDRIVDRMIGLYQQDDGDVGLRHIKAPQDGKNTTREFKGTLLCDDGIY
jgi:hypothetical protein